MKIGIYGGSFNPIHRGHIALAQQIRRKKWLFEQSRKGVVKKLYCRQRLDEVWFMVAPQNPLKQADSDLWDDDMRLSLVRKALENEDGLVASDYEFRLPRPSYTWDTLQALAKDYPEHDFTLIIGADNWLQFDSWYRADDILKNYRIIVYPREGCDIDPATLPPSVTLVNTKLYRVSSTEIRRRLHEGKTVRRFLPPVIYDEAVAYYENSHR